MTIQPSRHEKAEWARLAQDAYAHGDTFLGNRFSAKAALPDGVELDLAAYDGLMLIYRQWLCFGLKAVAS